MTTPHRPRLAPWVRPRLHHFSSVDGRPASSHVVLHDARTHASVHLETRLFAMLALADGTRDLDALTLAAEREGALRRRSELRALVDQLAAKGLLVDGLASPGERAAVAAIPDDRPLDVLPFALVCDGRGGCCRQYPSITFSDVEATRARVLAPKVLDGLAHPDRVFLPLAGDRRDAHGVALVDGACAYLAEPDVAGARACGLHPRKPLGCSLYPATFVDDGEAVRVAVKVECDCVARSVGRSAGEPLIPAAARSRGALDPALEIRSLPERVVLDETRAISRPELVRRRAHALAGLAALEATEVDAAALASAMADEAASFGEAALPGASAPSFARLEPTLTALAARTRAMSDAAVAWRSPRDRARRLRRLCAEAAERLLQARALPGPRDEERALELFHLRAAVFGHALVGDTPGSSLASELRGLAVRISLARAVDAEPGEHALTLVEATMRIADGRD